MVNINGYEAKGIEVDECTITITLYNKSDAEDLLKELLELTEYDR